MDSLRSPHQIPRARGLKSFPSDILGAFAEGRRFPQKMVERPTCAICAKRRPERFCPAKGEKICAPCCGREREVTLDCPPDCAYLIAAHRYEQEHRKPLTEAEIPFPGVEFSSNLIYEREPFVSGLAFTISQFAAKHSDLTDEQTLTAIGALGETYRTLVSGIYYERPPGTMPAAALYGAMAGFVQDYKKKESERVGFSTLKDSEIFYLLVFLARLARNWTNGRPRARIYLQFLRGQFPQRDAQPEASRIIAP
jgi:hypothetical protein